MKKIRILALLMVFAFAALGGAYAMWSDSLLIAETVETGTLDVTFLPEESFNPDPGPNYLGYVGEEGNPYGVYGVTTGNEGLDELDPLNPNANKNIGKIEYVISNQQGDGAAFSNINDLMTITLENGYPGYQERIFTTIKNVGTVPAKFNVSDINAAALADKLLVEIWFDGDPEESKDYGDDYMIWSNDPARQDDYRDAQLNGYQIDPDEEIPVAIYTRVRQAACQDKTYKFSIKLDAQQWNEYEFPLPNDIQGNTENRVDRLIDGVAQPVEHKF